MDSQWLQSIPALKALTEGPKQPEIFDSAFK